MNFLVDSISLAGLNQRFPFYPQPCKVKSFPFAKWNQLADRTFTTYTRLQVGGALSGMPGPLQASFWSSQGCEAYRLVTRVSASGGS